MPERTDEQVWYQNGLSFECTQCGNCCSGPTTGFVWVDEDEIRSIAQAMEVDDIDEFERRFVRRVGARKSLVEYADGDCIFLDPTTRGCSIYPVRPRQCRTWPFWYENLSSPKAWSKTAAGCPGCNRGRLYSLDEIQLRLSGD
jgi:Fe-S-cluster containining protein